MSSDPVVIIGAGPAGLTAACELAQRGIETIVLERTAKIGGISRTESYKNYSFDVGGHRFFTKVDEINRIWHEMLGRDFIKVGRKSSIYYRGRFFNYPLEALNALLNLGVYESFLIGLSYLGSRFRPYPQEDTFDQWVSNRFGHRLYNTFFKTYTEKVWGIPCSRIRADWAAQRIKGLSFTTALTNALFGTKKAKTLIDEFDYPQKGPGMMWERFGEVLKSKGGQIWLNSRAIGIEQEKGHASRVLCANEKGSVEIRASHVISSAPLPDLVRLFRPEAPPEVLDAADNLSYRAFVLVGLILNKGDLFPDQWIYIHSPDVKVGRIQNFKNWSRAMVPDPETTSLGLEYFCTVGDEIWSMSDDKLRELATEELAHLGLAGEGDVKDGFVLRQEGAYPIYNEVYRQSLEIIRPFLGSFDNLQTIGRNGLHRYNNMDHSMLTAMLAVENVFGGKHDLWEVNEEQDYLEENKKTKAEYEINDKFLKKIFTKIDKLALAIATGTVSGLFILLATLWLVIKGWNLASPKIALLSQYFFGYSVTVKGAFIAFGYSFFWGFLFGWLFAYLRNLSLGFYLYRVKKKTEMLTLKDFFDYI